MEEPQELVPEEFESEQPLSDELKSEDLKSGKKAPEEKTAITINIQSWATPIIALLMLVLGFFAGFYLRPGGTTASQQPAAVAQVSTPEQPQTDPATNEQLISFLQSQERHSLGDPNAPVTIYGFSDFQ